MAPRADPSPALFVRRVPTVMSLRQISEECESNAATTLANPKAPVSEIESSLITRYVSACPAKGFPSNKVYGGIQGLVDSDSDGSLSLSASSDDDESPAPDVVSEGSVQVAPETLMDFVLLGLWEEKFTQGLFRYDVTACQTKIIPGAYGFIAQLNEGRATKKRATEFRVDQVVQQFDDGKFNFKKAYLQEVLFEFAPTPIDGGASYICDNVPSPANPNLVIINVSPIEYGHVLLCPRVMDCIPQLVDPSTVLLALQFANEANNQYMRVGYNSLGAYATINHLHFQAYYLAAPFPCERAPTAPLQGFKGCTVGSVRVLCLQNYPVRGFVFEATGSLKDVADLVGEACLQMQHTNQPHNLFITDSGRRVFLFPQCYAAKQARGEVPEELLETGVNPACWEISGHIVLKRKTDYDNIDQDLIWRLLAEVSLTEEEFYALAAKLFPTLVDGSQSVAQSKALQKTYADFVSA